MASHRTAVRAGLFVVVAILAAVCGGGGGGIGTAPGTPPGTTPGTPVSGAPPQTASHALIAWNDLGMHCMDNDYSVFSILPPYNNLHAQLVDRATGRAVTAGVTVTYEATADTRASVNSTSAGKTSFWSYVQALFGVSLPVNMGLAGNAAPAAAPASLVYDSAAGFWRAEGIPITAVDDAGLPNFYPMVRVVARDAQGTLLAETKTVLPVSDEMTCKRCHASGGSEVARPPAGWVFDDNAERDYRLNILRFHDSENFASPTSSALYASALAGAGYNATGLENTVRLDGRPVLCAACHASNALGTAGAPGVKPLTAAVHSRMATAELPPTGLQLDSITDRSACYACHPGGVTQCLRGAMGNAKDAAGNPTIQCRSCHGNMSAVGDPARRGWIDLPDCSQCHYLSPATGTYVRDIGVFAPGGAERPASGIFASPVLYKAGTGHGGMRCEACHGPTHAEYPSSEPNDAVQGVLLQGHAGKITECGVCHATVPLTGDGGPHGLHTIGQAWVTAHNTFVAGDPAQCRPCHGPDYLGTFLSAVSLDRSVTIDEQLTKILARGRQVGCFDCHDGPRGG
ncbi:MAG: cytochrome C [Thermodesulfobacteriota bacterium]